MELNISPQAFLLWDAMRYLFEVSALQPVLVLLASCPPLAYDLLPYYLVVSCFLASPFWFRNRRKLGLAVLGGFFWQDFSPGQGVPPSPATFLLFRSLWAVLESCSMMESGQTSPISLTAAQSWLLVLTFQEKLQICWGACSASTISDHPCVTHLLSWLQSCSSPFSPRRIHLQASWFCRIHTCTKTCLPRWTLHCRQRCKLSEPCGLFHQPTVSD